MSERNLYQASLPTALVGDPFDDPYEQAKFLYGLVFAEGPWGIFGSILPGFFAVSHGFSKSSFCINSAVYRPDLCLFKMAAL